MSRDKFVKFLNHIPDIVKGIIVGVLTPIATYIVISLIFQGLNYNLLIIFLVIGVLEGLFFSVGYNFHLKDPFGFSGNANLWRINYPNSELNEAIFSDLNSGKYTKKEKNKMLKLYNRYSRVSLMGGLFLISIIFLSCLVVGFLFYSVYFRDFIVKIFHLN